MANKVISLVRFFFEISKWKSQPESTFKYPHKQDAQKRDGLKLVKATLQSYNWEFSFSVPAAPSSWDCQLTIQFNDVSGYKKAVIQELPLGLITISGRVTTTLPCVSQGHGSAEKHPPDSQMRLATRVPMPKPIMGKGIENDWLTPRRKSLISPHQGSTPKKEMRDKYWIEPKAIVSILFLNACNPMQWVFLFSSDKYWCIF